MIRAFLINRWKSLFKEESTFFRFHIYLVLKKFNRLLSTNIVFNKHVIIGWITSTSSIVVNVKMGYDVFKYRLCVYILYPFFKKVNTYMHNASRQFAWFMELSFLEVVSGNYTYYLLLISWPFFSMYLIILLLFNFSKKLYLFFFKNFSKCLKIFIVWSQYLISDIYGDIFFLNKNYFYVSNLKIKILCIERVKPTLVNLINGDYVTFLLLKFTSAFLSVSVSFKNFFFALYNWFFEFIRIASIPFLLSFSILFNIFGWPLFLYRELTVWSHVLFIFYKYRKPFNWFKNKILNFFPRCSYKYFYTVDYIRNVKVGFLKLYKYAYNRYWNYVYIGRNYPLFGIENEIDDSQIREFTWLHLEWVEKNFSYLFEHINHDYIVARLGRINKKKNHNLLKRAEYLYRYRYFEWTFSNFDKKTFLEKQSIFRYDRGFFLKKHPYNIRGFFFRPKIYNISMLLIILCFFQILKSSILKLFYMFSGKTGFELSKSLFLEGQINQHFSRNQLYNIVRSDEVYKWGSSYELFKNEDSHFILNYYRAGWWPDRGKLPARNVIYTHWKNDLFNSNGFDYYWFIFHRHSNTTGDLMLNQFDEFSYLVIFI